MERKELLALFNEILTKVYSAQKEKYKKKKKYEFSIYNCCEREKDQIASLFQELLTQRDSMDYDKFKKLMDGLVDSE